MHYRFTNTQWWRHHLSVLPPSPMSPLFTIFGYSSHPSPGDILFEQPLKDLFLICIWDILKTSHKRHLLWNVFETSSRRHIKDIFFEMYSRRLKNVSKKTSFFETSRRCRKKDVFFEMYLRCLKDVSKKTSFLRCFWDVFEKSLSAET